MAPPTKTIKDFEQESERQVNGCLLHWSPRVYRRVFILRHGEIAPGLCVCHKCDTPRCIEDNHHFLGTQADNIKDARLKGHFKHSAETRTKIGAKSRGRKASAETKLKMSLRRKGVPKPESFVLQVKEHARKRKRNLLGRFV